ncbi:MAG: GntR family transcriptional regulator [Pelomonas sp.]|nr:GntR family transcriptional regulator [Roseateles sp.]
MSESLAFSINPGSPEPIYRQLMEQLRRRVASGALVAGQELPSVRELALALAVNPMTISKAYGLLEAEGLLERRRGLSMVVAAKHRHARSQAERIALLRPALQQAAEAARQLEVGPRDALELFKTILQEEPK